MKDLGFRLKRTRVRRREDWLLEGAEEGYPARITTAADIIDVGIARLIPLQTEEQGYGVVGTDKMW